MDHWVSKEHLYDAMNLLVGLLHLTNHLIAQVRRASVTLSSNANKEVDHDRVWLRIKEIEAQTLLKEHLERPLHNLEKLCGTHLPVFFRRGLAEKE